MTSDLGTYFAKLLEILCIENPGHADLRKLRNDFEQDRKIAFLAEGIRREEES